MTVRHNLRLSINRPTKRGKEKSSSDGHCQYEKEMDDHLLACQQILERQSHAWLKREQHHFRKLMTLLRIFLKRPSFIVVL
jgi:hypothetical protein